MKKIIFLILLAACMVTCKNQYDNIKDFVKEEIVYPGCFDTISVKIGFERVELDLLKAGRIPEDQINLGKAKNTIVEYDDKKIEYKSVCSWVNITGLVQPKMYRFTVYTTDEYGNKSVPQEITAKPYFSSDLDYLLMAAPRVSSSPWAIDLRWPQTSSVLLKYISMTYKYSDKNGDVKTGEFEEGITPNIQIPNLDPEEVCTVEVQYTVVPKADNEQILDTVVLKNEYVLKTPSADNYRKNLIIRGIKSNSYSWAGGNLSIDWNTVNDVFMRYTEVVYYENNVEKVIQVPNTENQTVLPGFTLGTTLQVRSNYEVVGVSDTYIDSFDKEFDPYIDLDRGVGSPTGWKCIYTSVAPATDGYPSGTDNSPGAHMAHLDGDIRTMLSLAKPTRNVNGSDNSANIPCVFILDLQYATTFNYLRVHSRTTDEGDGLRWWGLRIFGSNNYLGQMNKFSNPIVGMPDADLTVWTLIGGEIIFPEPRITAGYNMMLPILEDFRYVKIECTKWQPPGNSAVQMAEFYLGLTSSKFNIN